jgi:2-amino-4-hydroxy-6-hydroxymethyldihydropteridine diphosphokinase
LLARSAWHATQPVGGPPGQGPFLNAAALVETSLVPRQVVARLLEIERAAGRTRHVRWDARPLDLDLLLYDRQQISEDGVETPHPRMNCRRFVLDPAAEIAPYMVHPACGWTVGALARQLREGRQVAWIAAADPARAERVAEHLRQQCGWQADVVGQGAASDPAAIAACNPRLLLACSAGDPYATRADAGGRGDAFRHRMRELSARWPVVWLSPAWDQCVAEAEAAVIAAGS